jgi:3',5'-cyclic AMP phosphodiesterase CpdA
MKKKILAALPIAICSAALAQNAPAPVWKFAVSGDSRNCGDVVMPAIASGVLRSGAAFYWHLGDFRAIYDFDEDMAPPAKLGLNTPHLTITDYLTKAWPDFIDRQIQPFGKLEVFLGIGNHETIYPKRHADFIKQFDGYLDSPRLRAQRAHDKDKGGVRTYYHWVMNNSTDFISLDNASSSTFEPAQLAWIRTRLADDRKSQSIKTIVVGMHEAFPGSKGMSHSMCDSPAGIAAGREVYEVLWNLEQSGKKVYLLASHSHFVMDDVYNTPYWQNKVLPGWIVGTAGAVRYRLPPNVPTATIARTDVYGYLLATVMSDGSIQFEFKEVTPDDLRKANAGRTPDSLIGWCVSENKNPQVPTPTTCGVK